MPGFHRVGHMPRRVKAEAKQIDFFRARAHNAVFQASLMPFIAQRMLFGCSLVRTIVISTSMPDATAAVIPG